MLTVGMWVLLVIATEAVTELIVASEIFNPLRLAVKRWAYPADSPPSDTWGQHLKVLLDKLLNCGYCASVWVAAGMALFQERYFESAVINWLVCLLVLHRLSNLYHMVNKFAHVSTSLIKEGRVRAMDLEVTFKEPPANGSARESYGEGADEDASAGESSSDDQDTGRY